MKIVAFDFDGTLAKSFPLIDHCMVETINLFGIKIDKNGMQKHYGPSEYGIFLNMFGPDKALEVFNSYLLCYEKCHDAYIPDVNKGIRELLEHLSILPIHVVLLTGRSKESSEISLRRLHISGFFEKIYPGSLYSANKADSLNKLAVDYGCSKDSIIYIGDSLLDVKLCQKAEVKILSVNYNQTDNYDNLININPGNVCKTVDELQRRLLDWAK